MCIPVLLRRLLGFLLEGIKLTIRLLSKNDLLIQTPSSSTHIQHFFVTIVIESASVRSEGRLD